MDWFKDEKGWDDIELVPDEILYPAWDEAIAAIRLHTAEARHQESVEQQLREHEAQREILRQEIEAENEILRQEIEAENEILR